jgi:hypothetical protein
MNKPNKLVFVTAQPLQLNDMQQSSVIYEEN